MSCNKGYGKKIRTNITIDKQLKEKMKKLVPNISDWVNEQMRKHVEEIENKK